ITGRTSDADAAAKRGLEAGDKGKQGRVLEVFPDARRILVEGVNRRTHHLKPTQAGGAGAIEQREAPIHVSTVALVDPENTKRTRGGGAAGIEQREAPLAASSVASVDPEDNPPTKVGDHLEEIELDSGRTKQVRVRYAKRSGKDI